MEIAPRFSICATVVDDGGKKLVLVGQHSEMLYVVLSGRLRNEQAAVHEPALERQSPDDYKGGQVLVAGRS